MNLIGTPVEVWEIVQFLKYEFAMKDLNMNNLYLKLEIVHCDDGILFNN